ncbi:hypothetical protein ACHHV8_03260 [Paenibacillus sp. TAB 01]|uniref:hypothetical protein n=1 Tax=Paenibacillus sp. TAB 01 TaxID=3368988 RepID=UPI00375129D0
MQQMPKEKIYEFLLDLRVRKDELEQIRAQHENTHEYNYLNGQLDEIIRILDNSGSFFEVDSREIDRLYQTQQSYLLGLKDREGQRYESQVQAFSPEHAEHKAEREFPAYRLTGVRKL